jgi:hypothetical protein
VQPTSSHRSSKRDSFTCSIHSGLRRPMSYPASRPLAPASVSRNRPVSFASDERKPPASSKTVAHHTR